MFSYRFGRVHNDLKFPLDRPPDPGEVLEVAPGVLWLRLPLPFRLDHVNIYLLEDGDGWLVIDTGINTPEAIQAWETLLAGRLSNLRISRVLVTHFHPDHIGLAGWLCKRFDAPLLASQATYMTSRVICLTQHELGSRQHLDFYASHGMSEEAARLVATRGNEYLMLVTELPALFLRLLMGDQINIGGRNYRVISGDGHAPEQTMLYCEEEGLLFAADQVMERISPNVGVYAGDRSGDPLGHYLRSLRFMRSEIPDSVLVLPGHGRPFIGLHKRCQELEDHHEHRCELIREACSVQRRSAADLVPILFARALDPHQMGFALTETLAHAHRLVRRGEITEVAEGEKSYFVAISAPESGQAILPVRSRPN